MWGRLCHLSWKGSQFSPKLPGLEETRAGGNQVLKHAQLLDLRINLFVFVSQ